MRLFPFTNWKFNWRRPCSEGAFPVSQRRVSLSLTVILYSSIALWLCADGRHSSKVYSKWPRHPEAPCKDTVKTCSKRRCCSRGHGACPVIETISGDWFLRDLRTGGPEDRRQREEGSHLSSLSFPILTSRMFPFLLPQP